MLFERGGKMGNGRVTKQAGNFGDCESFFVQKIFGMFHTLALVEIKNGSAEKLLKSFFKVAFVNSYFATKFLDGNRLPDVLQKNFTGANDFLPVVLICEEFALETFNILVAQHTFEAVQQQHLRLSVDVNIL